jgi:energy-coupling factor transport system ATP-binding protein
VSIILPYIELKNVSYRYQKGGFALRNVSLSFFEDEFAAITGPNGSGKTTIGKLCAGIFKPDRGEIVIGGKNSRDMALGEIGSKIGYLFQNPDRQLFTPSVYEEVSFALELKGCGREETRERTYEALDAFSLTHLEKSPPFKLSRGEKQRLALAAMLVNRPDFLILDEPTTGLDMERRAILSGIIDKLRCKGMGMIVISHDNSFIERHAARMIKVCGGEIVDDFRKQP